MKIEWFKKKKKKNRYLDIISSLNRGLAVFIYGQNPNPFYDLRIYEVLLVLLQVDIVV